MITLLSPHYKLEHVSENDIIIASLTWGVTIGFGALTVWSAIKQTVSLYQRRKGISSSLVTPYIVMIWIELIVCATFSVICWLYLRGQIKPSFAFYFVILTLWALQVQLLLQIIINRVSVLMVDRKKAKQIKWGVAILITMINISVYCVWLPARLQVSEHFIHINDVWDRVEKSIYLVVDALLNIFFIHTVQRQLVKPGLKKYRPLVKFNLLIIGLSLGMDVLIISTMSLPNSFVYMQFHPLAYVVKLKIEMSMADLITSVARARDKIDNIFVTGSQQRAERREQFEVFKEGKTGAAAVVKAFDSNDSSSQGLSGGQDTVRGGPDTNRGSRDIEMGNLAEAGPSNMGDHPGGFVVHRQKEVHMEVERLPSSEDGWKDGQTRRESDERPFCGPKETESSYTKVWGSNG